MSRPHWFQRLVTTWDLWPERGDGGIFKLNSLWNKPGQTIIDAQWEARVKQMPATNAIRRANWEIKMMFLVREDFAP